MDFVFHFRQRDKFNIGHINDQPIVKFIKNIVRPGFNCIDIGANVGVTALYISKFSENGIVWAVEPEESNFRLLQRHVGENNIKNITCFQYVISNRIGNETLYWNRKNYGDHRFWNDRSTREGRTKFTKKGGIQSLTLDALTENSAITFDFVKVDVQGMEYHVLSGSRKFLLNNPECIFLVEFWPYGLQSASSLDAFCDLLFELFNDITIAQSGEKISKIQLKRSPTRRKCYSDLVCRNTKKDV